MGLSDMHFESTFHNVLTKAWRAKKPKKRSFPKKRNEISFQKLFILHVATSEIFSLFDYSWLEAYL